MKPITTFSALLAMSLLVVTVLSTPAQNPALDDVDVRIEEGMAQVRVRMTFPVRYLRHFPAAHGQQLDIAFQIAALNPGEVSLTEETRSVAATPALPGFTVTYVPPPLDNVGRDPATLRIRFDRAVSYQVGGTEGRESITLYIPITPAETGNQK